MYGVVRHFRQRILVRDSGCGSGRMRAVSAQLCKTEMRNGGIMFRPLQNTKGCLGGNPRGNARDGFRNQQHAD